MKSTQNLDIHTLETMLDEVQAKYNNKKSMLDEHKRSCQSADAMARQFANGAAFYAQQRSKLEDIYKNNQNEPTLIESRIVRKTKIENDAKQIVEHTKAVSDWKSLVTRTDQELAQLAEEVADLKGKIADKRKQNDAESKAAIDALTKKIDGLTTQAESHKPSDMPYETLLASASAVLTAYANPEDTKQMQSAMKSLEEIVGMINKMKQKETAPASQTGMFSPEPLANSTAPGVVASFNGQQTAGSADFKRN